MLPIGRALMSYPKLLLLDEPSMGLAPNNFHELFDAIVGLNKAGTTVLVIEQKAYLTLCMINRGYVLTNGLVTIEGTGAELLKNREVQDAYLGQSSGGAGKLGGMKLTTSGTAPQTKSVVIVT